MNTESIKVVLVEDNPHDALMVQRLLRDRVAPCFELTTVNMLADALPALRSSGGDVILLDLSLPDSHGLESLTKLAIAVPHLPIIVLTGFDDDAANAQALRSGAQDYIVKGSKAADQLCRAICNAIERKAFEQQLAQKARADYLTGLGNRLFLEECLEDAVARATRIRSHIALMYINLDDFKTVNDMYGHSEGDRVLQQTAEIIRSIARSGEAVARLGSDEFAILLDPIRNDAAAIAALRRFAAVFDKKLPYPDEDKHMTISMGIAIFPHQAKDAHELLRNAEKAMIRAKALGKGNFQLYDPDANQP